MMAINGHSKLNRTDNMIEMDVQGVIDTLKSLNRPLTTQSFRPVGFQDGLQDALLREIPIIDDRIVQVPNAPPPPPPTFPGPRPIPPIDNH